jgi:arylsulfatase A-like enzyme
VSERNNVLLVILDSVRAKNTSLHGYDRETTPFLCEFVDRSTVYTQARAPGIHSIASHVSMFTGAHVEEHGATHHTTEIDPSRTVWHELGTEHGYATGLFTNNRIVSNASNLGDSFGYVHEPDYPLTDRLENRIDGTILKRAYFRGYDGLARLTAALGFDDEPETGTPSVDRDDTSGTDTHEGNKIDEASGADRTDGNAVDALEGKNGTKTGGEHGGRAKSKTGVEDSKGRGSHDTSAGGTDASDSTGSGQATDNGVVDTLATGMASGVGRLGAIAGLSGGDPGYKTLFGGTFTDAFFEWESRQDGPWAACINLMDAHSPYEPDAEFDRWADERHREIQREAKPSVWETLDGRGWDRMAALEPLYDGAIRQTDAIVRDLVAELSDRGVLSETLLVVTSDHGETFGERSRLCPDVRLRDHKWGIHEALTHVPLVVSYPDQQEGRVVEEAVSLTDTPALVRTAAADRAGEDPLTGSEVLASTFRLPEKKVSKYGSIDGIEQYVGPWRAVYESREETVRKFARTDEHGLTLDIERPGEVTEIARDDDGRVAEVYDRLTDTDLVTSRTTDIDEDLEQQLEDLGYIR